MPHLLFFVHGLTGDASTFDEFAKLVSQDPLLNSAIKPVQWSYPTKFASVPFIKTSPRIQDLADSLRTELDHQTETNIILVCHSLGGIIARRMLLDDVKKKRPFLVKHLFLYATPNEGADLAKLAKTISLFQPQLKQLVSDSDFIDSLNSDWHISKMEKRLSITYVVGALDSVVSIKSASGFWGNERVQTIPNGDHTNVIKPESLADIRYRIFQKAVVKTLESPKESNKKTLSYRPKNKLPVRCIIVDDNTINCKLIKKFCDNNPSVEVLGMFENGRTALDFLSEHEVDLIFLDVQMPIMSGFELLEQIKVIPYVILISGKTEYAYKAFQYQVTDYIQKPVYPERLGKALEKVIDLYLRA